MVAGLISGDTETDYPVELIGGKAKGLIALKQLLPDLTASSEEKSRRRIIVPDFFIVPSGYDLSNIETILSQAEQLAYRFAVRSSSPFEDGIEHSFDGVFDTCLKVDISGLIEAIETVRASAQGQRAQQYAADFGLTIDDRMAVIVQEMVHGSEIGVIYSKFPASINVTKIVTWSSRDEESRDFTVLRRIDTPERVYSAGKVIEGRGLEDNHAAYLAGISYLVEGRFGFPVRIEYQRIEPWNNFMEHTDDLHLLQARSVAGIKNVQNITLPEIKEGNLLLGTYEVNGVVCDHILPVVIVPNAFTFFEGEEMDRRYSDGYALVGDDVTKIHSLCNWMTPNKKAVFAITASGFNHGLDIGREKDILYLTAEGVWTVFYTGSPNMKPLKTGDLVRAVSDGIKGLVYKVDD